MIKYFSSRWLCSLALLSLIQFQGVIMSQEPNDQDADQKSGEESMTCSKEVLMTFFPQPIVRAILIRNKVPTDQAETISRELASRDQDIVKMVEKKASQKENNPFRDFSHREEAIKMFRETLYEVFSSVLKKYGMNDDEKMRTLLDDIQEAKGRLFVECIKKENLEKGNQG